MLPLTLLVKAGLYLIMAISLLAAVASVSLPNIFHAALALALALLGIAGIYLGLQAEFVAVVQVLIYVGAVITLVIFAIMLTNRMADRSTPAKNSLGAACLAVAAGLFSILVRFIRSTPWPETTSAPAPGTSEIGQALMGPYVFAFEVISVILIAVLIGAMVIAKKDNPGGDAP